MAAEAERMGVIRGRSSIRGHTERFARLPYAIFDEGG